ncbi:hypothetical protein [Sphingomonas hankyongi]|uniref:Uncharacterized protein n=1 Tax=Sphingomonas hankyongi TaxID=2908209 RepID=A0ABT0RZ47_9SPHN|nr:hypothetical protein [Sphingomonas hankyongi]MCL6728668.1 hypothetical protein [Sphingomonas hankyongi]
MKPFTTIAAVIFLLMGLLHIYRIVAPFPVTIGGTSVGPEISWLAVVVTLGLAFGLWREARR